MNAPVTKGPRKDPIGPPLEEVHLREFFRRFAIRPVDEQKAFVKRLNWNLVDAHVEAFLMRWLANALAGPQAQFAVSTLDKLPHSRRVRHIERFRRILPELEPSLAAALQNAFGPVLGGLPKRPQARPGTVKGASQPPSKATEDDLQQLKAFFDKFGGNR